MIIALTGRQGHGKDTAAEGMTDVWGGRAFSFDDLMRVDRDELFNPANGRHPELVVVTDCTTPERVLALVAYAQTLPAVAGDIHDTARRVVVMGVNRDGFDDGEPQPADDVRDTWTIQNDEGVDTLRDRAAAALATYRPGYVGGQDSPTPMEAHA